MRDFFSFDLLPNLTALKPRVRRRFLLPVSLPLACLFACLLACLLAFVRSAMVSASSPSPDGASGASRAPRRVLGSAIPRSIAEDPELAAAIERALPSGYDFELYKTVTRIRALEARTVALQFPEGLLMFSLAIADVLTAHAGVDDVIVLGDVAYGACCVDDLGAKAAGADLLVHYGHSCLVPVGITAVPCLYVFVTIQADVDHLVRCVRETFYVPQEEGKGEGERAIAVAGAGGDASAHKSVVNAGNDPLSANGDAATANGGGGGGGRASAAAAGAAGAALSAGAEKDAPSPPAAAPASTDPATSLACLSRPLGARLAIAGTIQFAPSVALARELLASDRECAVVPRIEPLSAGEVLGCTAPTLPPGIDAVVFVADGRFHLEALMMANPSVPVYMYDPYSKKLTRERYDHDGMKRARRRAITLAQRTRGSEQVPEEAGAGRQTHGGNARRGGGGEAGETRGDGLKNDLVDGSENAPHNDPADVSGRCCRGSRGTGSAPCCGDQASEAAETTQSSCTLSACGTSTSDADQNPTTATVAGAPSPSSPSSSPSLSSPPTWGIVLGTLGRQGNPALAARVERAARARGIEVVRILASELSPQRLGELSDGGRAVQTFVQIACPRLSIDWGEYFPITTLNAYEALVALHATKGWWEDQQTTADEKENKDNNDKDDANSKSSADSEDASSKSSANSEDAASGRPWESPETLSGTYPMDYYSNSGAPWTGAYERPKPKAPPARAAGGKGGGAAAIRAALAARRKAREETKAA